MRLLWHVTPSGPARLHQRGAGGWTGRHRPAAAGRGPRLLAGKSYSGLAGGLSSQGLAAHGISADPLCGPDLVCLVALVLGIMDHILIRGGTEVRVLLAIGDHPDPA